MADSLGVGTLSLQSGIVVAALIVAVLLAERLGGDAALARKVTQVALAIAIALTVFSGTAAFLRPPQAPEGVTLFGDTSQSEEELEKFLTDSAERDSEAGSLHLGIGIALAAAGGALLRRFRVIPASLLLSGVLLLLLGAAPQSGGGAFNDSLSAIYAPLLRYATDAGQARDIVRFVVLLAGTVLVAGFTVSRWEGPPEDGPPATEPVAPPEPPTPDEPLPEAPAGT